MSDNGQAPQTYRFMELAPQHQVQLLRQAILQREQQLYGLVLQQRHLEGQKGLVLADLEGLRGEIQGLLRPQGQGQGQGEPQPEATEEPVP